MTIDELSLTIDWLRYAVAVVIVFFLVQLYILRYETGDDLLLLLP